MTDNTEPLPSKPLDPPAQDEVEAVANVLAATMRAGRGINDSDVFVTMATAAITALRQHQTAETEALRGENARLREALKALLDACYQADGLEELPECIDGTLLDDADAALELQYPVIWTDQQVAILQARQEDASKHPYTCGGDRSDRAHTFHAEETGEARGQLYPTVRGWRCPACDYRQFWSHETGGPAALGGAK